MTTWGMAPLLAAVRDALAARPVFAGRAVVVADPTELPDELECPCVTVRDGGTELVQATTAQSLARHHIVVDVFAENVRDRASAILGDAVQGLGVEALVQETVEALRDNDLGLPGVLDQVRPESLGETAIVVRPARGQEVVHKPATWLYRQQPSI